MRNPMQAPGLSRRSLGEGGQGAQLGAHMPPKDWRLEGATLQFLIAYLPYIHPNHLIIRYLSNPKFLIPNC